jgi:hypothetical protein
MSAVENMMTMQTLWACLTNLHIQSLCSSKKFFIKIKQNAGIIIIIIIIIKAL